MEPPRFFHSNPCAEIPFEQGCLGSSHRGSTANCINIVVSRRGVVPILVPGKNQTGTQIHQFGGEALLFLNEKVPIFGIVFPYLPTLKIA